MARRREFITDLERKIYYRHLLLPELGEKGQLRLLNGRVLVVGLGGLGSPALLYLAACGVGELGMADADTVEHSNLQRQILHGYRDVGRSKTSSAHDTISMQREDVRLNIHPVRLSHENARDLISRYDFVVEATDNFESKFLVNDVCVSQGKAFSHAGILGTGGQAMTIVPGEGPCFRCIFDDPPPPGAVKTTDEVGVLGVVPGILGAIHAAEAVKYLSRCGELLVGRLLTFDAFTMAFREIRLPVGKRCPVCKGALN